MSNPLATSKKKPVTENVAGFLMRSIYFNFQGRERMRTLPAKGRRSVRTQPKAGRGEALIRNALTALSPAIPR